MLPTFIVLKECSEPQSGLPSPPPHPGCRRQAACMVGADSLRQSGGSSYRAQEADTAPPSRMLSSKVGRKPFSILAASLLTKV